MAERLTQRQGNIVTYTGKHTKLPGIDCASSMRVPAVRDVMERLAEYEDVGLAPEELAALKKILHGEVAAALQPVMDSVTELLQRAADNLTPEQITKALTAPMPRS